MEYFPSSYKTFKVSLDSELASAASIVFDYLNTPGKLVNSLDPSSEIYRSCTLVNMQKEKGFAYQKDLNSFVPKYINEILFTKVVSKIGKDCISSSVRFEESFPAPELKDYPISYSRFKKLKVLAEDSRSFKEGKPHSPTLWHFDNYAPYNNIACILYLSDVSEIGGGTEFANPVTLAVYRDVNYSDNYEYKEVDENKTFGSKNFIRQIKGTPVHGPKGTVVAFNSHILHRAGIPEDKPRKAVVMNFYTKDPNLTFVNKD